LSKCLPNELHFTVGANKLLALHIVNNDRLIDWLFLVVQFVCLLQAVLLAA
jgi:hypothetical protein